jgi:hypothetical protein
MCNLIPLKYLIPPRPAAVVLLLGLAAVVPGGGQVRADDPKDASKPQTVVAKSTLGALLHRQGPDHAWHLIKPREPIQSEDLIVAVPGGGLDSKDGAVHLSLLSDLARLSPYPVLESAVILHDNPEVDLDFTLDRGRVDLTNHKKKGPAHVRVRFRDQKWDLTLNEPKSRVALELYGRWPKGIPFSKDPKSTDEPTTYVVLLALHGDVDVRAGGSRFAMSPPPGPAYFHWDSAGGQDEGPRQLGELPNWARPTRAMLPRVKDLTAALKVLERRLAEKTSIEEALVESLDSKDADTRRVAVYGLGALDNLPALVNALSDPKHEDVREVAVVALRHWIGRGKGQDLKLYDVLVKEKQFSPNQAAIVLQLLHSFGDPDLARPATYETLIDYLMHDKLAIRELAWWHLYRLVEAGKDVAYDAAAPEAQRQAAYDKWKELIPSGKLPPQPKKEP